MNYKYPELENGIRIESVGKFLEEIKSINENIEVGRKLGIIF